jgi:hypothetical protein
MLSLSGNRRVAAFLSEFWPTDVGNFGTDAEHRHPSEAPQNWLPLPHTGRRLDARRMRRSIRNETRVFSALLRVEDWIAAYAR